MLLPMTYPGLHTYRPCHPRLLAVFSASCCLLSLYQWKLARHERLRLLYLLIGAVAIEAVLGLVQF
jgi:O-antigen polymerase